MTQDFKEIYSQLVSQADKTKHYKAYYDGDQPLMYSNERLREVFQSTNIRFVQNWASVVVNSVLDRLEFNGWDDPSDSITAALNTYYYAHRLAVVSRDVHRDALATGDGFIMADLIDGQVKLYYNPPTAVAVRYKDSLPDELEYGIKVWYNWRENITYANLYYEKHIEKYKANGTPAINSSFELYEQQANPFMRIPIIHFKAENVLADIITLQDAINKLFADMMVVAEFNAFRQRWMITNADISALVASPQSIMQIPKGMNDEEGTQIGEFSAADLGMYLDTMDKLANAIAVISRIPKHYFVATGSAISGEALTVMEAPLVKKVSIQAKTLGQGWQEVAKLIGGSEYSVPVWANFYTEQPQAIAQTIKTLVETGVPLMTVLKRSGWSEGEVEQLLSDLEEEQERRTAQNATAIEMAIMRAAANNHPLG